MRSPLDSAIIQRDGEVCAEGGPQGAKARRILVGASKGVLVKVVSVKGMSPEAKMLHIVNRHGWLRFASRGEHDADHRLHPERMDHEHDQ